MSRNTIGYKAVNRLFVICFMIIFIFIAWAVISHTVDGLALFTIATILLIAWFAHPKRTWLYLLMLVVISFGIKYFTILHLTPPPVQDFKTILEAAQGLLAGDKSFNQLKYFYDWAYQTPFVLYDMLILKIHNDVAAIKLVNCLAAVGINVLIYLTLKGFVQERFSKAIATVFAFMPFTAIMGTWLSNQPMATFLTYMGLYFVVKKGNIIRNHVVRWALAGVLVSLGNLMRPEGLVVLVAVGVLILMQWLREFDKAAAIEAVKAAAAFILPYFLVGLLASQLIIFTGINPNGVKNNNPYWKFTLGFNHQAKGMWNQEDYDWLAEQEQKADKSVKEIQTPLIMNRIFAHPDQLPELFANKAYIFWAFPRLYPAFDYLKEGDAELNLSVEDLKRYQEKREYYLDYLNKIDIWMFLLMMGLAMFGCYVLCREDMRQGEGITPHASRIFAYMVFATAVVYLLIEVQPRYVYFIQPAVMILAGYGLRFFKE